MTLCKKMLCFLFSFEPKHDIVISERKTSRVEMYALSAWRTGSCLRDESQIRMCRIAIGETWTKIGCGVHFASRCVPLLMDMNG